MDATSQAPREPLPGHLFVLSWQLTEFGGVNSVVKGLYRAMDVHGQTAPHVLINLWDPETLKPSNNFRVSSLRIRAPWGKPRFKSFISFFINAPSTLSNLRRLLDSHKIRVINPHYPGLECFLFRFARRLFGVKLVLSLHGSELIDFMIPSNGIDRWWYRLLLSGADFLVVPCHSLGRRLRAFMPALEDRIRVVWNGTEPDAFRELAEQSTIATPPEPYAVILGGFEILNSSSTPPSYRKGQDVAIQAWAEVSQQHPDARLVLVGTGGANANWIRQQAAVTRGVVLLENQSDAAVSRLISKAAMLVLPSRANESFGIALIEAGAHSVPVVSTLVDGIPEVVRDGIDGFLVPPEDPATLALAMNKLFADRELGRRMGMNFRGRVAAQFTWARARAEYEDLARAPRLQDAPSPRPLAIRSEVLPLSDDA